MFIVYCSITNYPKISWFITAIIICCLSVSMGQKFRQGAAEMACFCFVMLGLLVGYLKAGCGAIWRCHVLIDAKAVSQNEALHQSTHMWPGFQGQVSQERARLKLYFLFDLVLKVVQHCFLLSLVLEANSEIHQERRRGNTDSTHLWRSVSIFREYHILCSCGTDCRCVATEQP